MELGTSPESQNSAPKADLAGPPEALSDRAENHDTSIPVVCSLDLSIYSDGLGLSVKPSPPPCAPEAWPQVGRPSSPATPCSPAHLPPARIARPSLLRPARGRAVPQKLRTTASLHSTPRGQRAQATVLRPLPPRWVPVMFLKQIFILR